MHGQDSLGSCYKKGIGVAQDMSQAVMWYRKAAEQGDQASKDSLARLGVH